MTGGVARCRACGQAIEFCLTAAGRWCPYDTGTDVSHVRTCPDARRFSRKAPPAPEDTCHGCGTTRVERLAGTATATHHPPRGERLAGTATHYAAIRCQDCGQHRWLRQPRKPTKPDKPGRPAAG